MSLELAVCRSRIGIHAHPADGVHGDGRLRVGIGIRGHQDGLIRIGCGEVGSLRGRKDSIPGLLLVGLGQLAHEGQHSRIVPVHRPDNLFRQVASAIDDVGFGKLQRPITGRQ